VIFGLKIYHLATLTQSWQLIAFKRRKPIFFCDGFDGFDGFDAKGLEDFTRAETSAENLT
jgi:hypothetical protein